MSSLKMLPINTIITVGIGHLMKCRLVPIQIQLAQNKFLRQVADVDIKEENPISQLRAHFPCRSEYFRVGDDSILPMDTLKSLGFIGEHSMLYISTPTPPKISYVEQALEAGLLCVVEKPPTLDLNEAIRLSKMPSSRLFCVDHYLWKLEMMFISTIINSKKLLNCSVIELHLLERALIGPRQVDNIIFDTAFHLLSSMCHIGHRIGKYPVKFTITGVEVAKYALNNGHTQPASWTAALVNGLVHFGDISKRLIIRVGKALPVDSKCILFYGKSLNSKPTIKVSLMESGWLAHYRLVEHLFTKELPNTRFSMTDMVNVVQACTDACQHPQQHPDYHVNEIPRFLLGGALNDLSHFCA